MNNGEHDFKAQSIYGDHIAFNRVKRLVSEVLDKRIQQGRMSNNGSGVTTNTPFLARPTWLEGGGEDDLDPRRSIWDECGYPATRFMSPQRWQTLNDRDAVANTVNEAMARYAWQVTPSVFEKEQGKVVTPWDKGWTELAGQLRYGGMPDWFGEVGGGPVEEVLERANALSGVGRFGVIIYGFDDGEGWAAPVPGIQEEGSQPAEQVIDADGKPVTNEIKDKRGNVIGHEPVFTVNKGDERRYVLNFANPNNPQLMRQTEGRKLLYLNAFSEAAVRSNRFETNKQSPRFGRPTSYQVTFQDPKNPIWGVGIPMSTENVHWTRIQHVCDTVDTYGNSMVFAIPRCQVPLNNILALSKLYHGAAEGFWKYALPYLFLSTHPQLGGDVDVDDEGLKDMIESMMNGLQKAGILAGMDAKMVGGNFSDPSPQINVHLEAIAMKKRMPVRILKGSERGELSSAQDDDAWDDQVVRYQTGYCTNGLLRPCANLLTWAGVLPQPQSPGSLKCVWPDVTSMSAEQKAQKAVARMTALSTYLNGGGGNALTLFDFMVNEWDYTEEQAMAAIQNAAKANGFDLAQTGMPEQINDPQEQEAIQDWTPPEATEGEGEDVPPAEQDRIAEKDKQPVSNVWSDEARAAAAEARRQGSVAHNATLKVAKVRAMGYSGAKASAKAAEAHDQAAQSYDSYLKQHHFQSAAKAGVPASEEGVVYGKMVKARDMHAALAQHHLLGNAEAGIDEPDDGEVDNERMCWGKPCPDDVESAPKNVAATRAKMLSEHARKTGADEHHQAAAQAHDEAAKAHFEHYTKSGDAGSLLRIKEHSEAAASHRSYLEAAATKHAPTPDPGKTIDVPRAGAGGPVVDPHKTVRSPEPKAATVDATLLRPPGKRVGK